MLNITNGKKNYRIHFEYPNKHKAIKKWITKCIITDRDTKDIVSKSVTKYNADDDKFDKALGRRIALSLAMKELFDREFRTKVWEFYKELISDEEKKVFKN